MENKRLLSLLSEYMRLELSRLLWVNIIIIMIADVYILSSHVFYTYTLSVPLWTPFAFILASILHSMILDHTDMTASHRCCTSTMWISSSTTCQRCAIGWLWVQWTILRWSKLCNTVHSYQAGSSHQKMVQHTITPPITWSFHVFLCQNHGSRNWESSDQETFL